MSWCIYKHTSPSGKSYIGMTCRSPAIRWRTNGRGYDKNTKIGQAIKKYGWNSFTHEILETNIDTLEQAKEREMYWVALFDSYKNGYNSTIGGDSVSLERITNLPVYQLNSDLEIVNEFPTMAAAGRALGISPSGIMNSVRQNGNQIKAGGYYWCAVADYVENWTPKQQLNIRPVICVETQTIYRTQTEAAKDMKIKNPESISYCCLRQGITAGGYHWAFVDEYNESWKPPEAKVKDLSASKRPVICHETQEIFDSTVAAAKQYKTSHSVIGRACREHRSVRNLHFAYLSEYTQDWCPKPDGRKISQKAVSIFCVETNKIYTSMREASNALQISVTLISRCCNGIIPSTHGYHFIKKEE